jgi:hypothetical protein
VLSFTGLVKEEGRGERKQLKSFLRPNRSIHHNFSGDSTVQKNSFLVIVYSTLFYIVIEAVNLVLEKIFSRNPPAWQYHSASLHTTKFYTEF